MKSEGHSSAHERQRAWLYLWFFEHYMLSYLTKYQWSNRGGAEGGVAKKKENQRGWGQRENCPKGWEKKLKKKLREAKRKKRGCGMKPEMLEASRHERGQTGIQTGKQIPRKTRTAQSVWQTEELWTRYWSVPSGSVKAFHVSQAPETTCAKCSPPFLGSGSITQTRQVTLKPQLLFKTALWGNVSPLDDIMLITAGMMEWCELGHCASRGQAKPTVSPHAIVNICHHKYVSD